MLGLVELRVVLRHVDTVGSFLYRKKCTKGDSWVRSIKTKPNPINAPDSLNVRTVVPVARHELPCPLPCRGVHFPSIATGRRTGCSSPIFMTGTTREILKNYICGRFAKI